MDATSLLERIQRAVMLESDDAAIRIHAEYEPQAGPTAKVFPPTYLPSNGSLRYHQEERWTAEGERVTVIVLDSYQSQANRCEAAILSRREQLGLPHLVMEATIEDTSAGTRREVRVSSLEAPHRSRDAYFLDSAIGQTQFDETEVGSSLRAASAHNATPFLQFAPYDLIYGVWDSHRGAKIALKFPRSYTSEMLAWDPIVGDRAATKGDPLVMPGDSEIDLQQWRPDWVSKDRKKPTLSKIGHGMVPGTLGTFRGRDERPTGPGGSAEGAPQGGRGSARKNDRQPTAPGVSARRVTREAVLSLTGLARFRFPAPGGDLTMEGRTALAALALLADRLAFGGAGLHLRSGADLRLLSERVEWVGRGDLREAFELEPPDAERLFRLAVSELSGRGLSWSPTTITVHPQSRLLEEMRKSFQPAIDESE